MKVKAKLFDYNGRHLKNVILNCNDHLTDKEILDQLKHNDYPATTDKTRTIIERLAGNYKNFTKQNIYSGDRSDFNVGKLHRINMIGPSWNIFE